MNLATRRHSRSVASITILGIYQLAARSAPPGVTPIT